MTGTKIYLLFTIPALFDFYYRAIETGEFKFNIVLLVVAISASFIGSTVQASHASLKKKVSKKEIIAIYVTGIFIAYITYEVGVYYNSFSLTGISSAILSYVSIDFVIMVKAGVLFVLKGVYEGLPKVILNIIKNAIGGDDKK